MELSIATPTNDEVAPRYRPRIWRGQVAAILFLRETVCVCEGICVNDDNTCEGWVTVYFIMHRHYPFRLPPGARDGRVETFDHRQECRRQVINSEVMVRATGVRGGVTEGCSGSQ